MRIWVDDVRSAPEGYVWCKSVNETIEKIRDIEFHSWATIELIDLDYDSGDYEKDGGPYIKLMDWLVERGTLYPLAFAKVFAKIYEFISLNISSNCSSKTIVERIDPLILSSN